MTVRGRAAALVRASHPEPAVAVTAVAAVLAVTSGHPPAGVVLVAAAVLAGQLSVGWLNDGLDAGRDAAAGRAEKPVAAGLLRRRTVLAAAAVSGAACLPLSWASGWGAGTLHVVAVLSAWGYDAGLKSTPVSVLPYAVSFGLLPAFVVAAAPVAPPWWLVAAGALLGSGAHFANALPDLATDAATGVRGLPHRLGAAGSRAAAAVLLLAGSLVLALGPAGPPTAAGVGVVAAALLALAVGAALDRRTASRALFAAVMAVAVLDVVLLLVSGTALRAP